MWTNVYDKLKAHNLNPYPPGIHKGICTVKYCVVREGTQMPDVKTNKLGQSVMDIILFIPDNDYPSLEAYKVSIRSALSELDYLRKTGFETAAITDDTEESITMSIEYVLQKKLEG